MIDALCDGPVHFKTIEGEQIEISIDKVISPDSKYVIKGKGMPIYTDDPLGPIRRNYARGDLIVRFDI